LGEIINTKIENREVSMDTTMDSGLEIGAEKSKYMSVYCEQYAGHNHNIKMGIRLSESPAKFKYLGTQMKTTSMKKLRRQTKFRRKPATIRYRICHPVCYQKYYQYTTFI